MDPTGVVHFVGRIDNQVQIRGYRVEPGEIEHTLQSHNQVEQAIIVIEDPDHTGVKELIGFVYTKNENLNDSILKDHLRKFLPEYMIPRHLEILNFPLPITSHGKTDRNNLPKITLSKRNDFKQDIIGPRDKIELYLTNLWKELLKLNEVDLEDNFFMLGGHSLIAIEMIERIKSDLGLELSISILLEKNSIDTLSQVIRLGDMSKPQSIIVPLKQVSETDKTPLFLFHPIGGNILCYSQLTSTLNTNVFGVQSPFLQDVTLKCTFEELIAIYVNEIETKYPYGEIHLGGFCAGGVLALEVYRILKQKGRQLGELYLIDTVAPPLSSQYTTVAEEEITKEFLLDNFYKDLTVQSGKEIKNIIPELKKCEENDQLVYVLNDAIQEKVVHKDTSLETLTNLFEAYYKNAVTMPESISEKYNEDIILFKAEKVAANLSGIEGFYKENLGWNERTTGLVVDSIIVPGDHNTMLTVPHVSVLAKELDTKLTNYKKETYAL